MPSNNHTYRCF